MTSLSFLYGQRIRGLGEYLERRGLTPTREWIRDELIPSAPKIPMPKPS